MNNYVILPFNFKTLGNKKLLVNQAGEYIFLSENEFKDFYEQKLTTSNPIYRTLQSKQFLSTNENIEISKDILALKLRTRKAFVSEFTSLHMIVVTLRCNCSCKYCHASSVDINAKEFDMDWETAQKTIEMIFQTPSQDIKIEYQGGEPLLNWEIVKESILYAEFLNKFYKKKLGFVICTNMIDINKNQLIFCRKHRVDLSSSLDGNKQIHDINRPSRIYNSSYDKFKTNLQMSRNILGQNGCSPLLTITKTNINHLKDIIDHYIELGFNNIFLRALNPYGNALLNKSELMYTTKEFIDAYKDALDYIIQLNKNGTNFVECYTALFLSRILTPYSTGFVDLQSPSGAGISGAIYNYDGNIYPADEARMLARMGDNYFCMGNVKTTSYKEAFGGEIIRNIVKSSCVETIPICSECAYQQYCGADVIRNYLETKDLYRNTINSDFCYKNKSILDHIFYLLHSNDDELLDIFWAWATRRSYKDIKIETN